MSQKQPIRILIADDHPIVRAGIAAMLEIQPEAKALLRKRLSCILTQKT